MIRVAFPTQGELAADLGKSAKERKALRAALIRARAKRQQTHAQEAAGDLAAEEVANRTQ